MLAFNLIFNLVFILSVLGLVVWFLRKLPEATANVETKNVSSNIAVSHSLDKTLRSKGLPFISFSKTKNFFVVIFHKLTQFLLEAKGLKPGPKVRYNFKKILGTEKEQDKFAILVKDEGYYIQQIRKNPKNFVNYDLLGQYYIKEKKFDEAVPLYEYLTNHAPTEVSYWARLGLVSLHVKDFSKSVSSYQRAVDLDNSNPGRFFNLALAQSGLGEFASAINSISTALSLDPNNKKYQDYKFELESKNPN